jgi:DNA-binding beta-propeller fold protein YncE
VAQGECRPRTPLYSLAAVAAARSGAIAVSDTGTSNVYRITAGKAIPVAAPDPAKNPFGMPEGLAFDTAGNLIVADLGLNAVLRVSGDQVATLASVEAPSGVCIDKAGGIVVVSASRRRLVRVGPGGKVTTIAEGPPFELPLAVTAAGDGSYVVADGYAAAIFKVSPDGRVSVLAKGGPLKHPTGVAAEPSGAFVVVDPQAKAVFRVSPYGEISKIHASK